MSTRSLKLGNLSLRTLTSTLIFPSDYVIFCCFSILNLPNFLYLSLGSQANKHTNLRGHGNSLVHNQCVVLEEFAAHAYHTELLPFFLPKWNSKNCICFSLQRNQQRKQEMFFFVGEQKNCFGFWDFLVGVPRREFGGGIT
ncbi:hypothetical protein VNO77_10196 [Canavalia gladiata]|uniref:Uncharacterized protein n=1 Tax=Canavalia gladiata TaxID=3824 RepID=A0AAN9QXF8_CANGL